MSLMISNTSSIQAASLDAILRSRYLSTNEEFPSKSFPIPEHPASREQNYSAQPAQDFLCISIFFFDPISSFLNPFSFSNVITMVLLYLRHAQAATGTCASALVDIVSSSSFGRLSTSNTTRIIRLQLGQTAISSPSRRSAMAISKRSPHGHG
jgi:hypothetical protein